MLRGCVRMLRAAHALCPCSVRPFCCLLLPVESNLTLTKAHTSLKMKITSKTIYKSFLQTDPNALSVLQGSLGFYWQLTPDPQGWRGITGFTTGFLCNLEQVPRSSKLVGVARCYLPVAERRPRFPQQLPGRGGSVGGHPPKPAEQGAAKTSRHAEEGAKLRHVGIELLQDELLYLQL